MNGDIGQLVLVVDDETALRTTMRLVLERSGYRVLTAEDGASALALIERHRDEVAVVVTDMMMPGMDGHSTIRGIHQLCPAMPVIAASGLPAPPGAETEVLGITAFLAKPFSIDALVGAVADALADHA